VGQFNSIETFLDKASNVELKILPNSFLHHSNWNPNETLSFTDVILRVAIGLARTKDKSPPDIIVPSENNFQLKCTFVQNFTLQNYEWLSKSK